MYRLLQKYSLEICTLSKIMYSWFFLKAIKINRPWKKYVDPNTEHSHNNIFYLYRTAQLVILTSLHYGLVVKHITERNNVQKYIDNMQFSKPSFNKAKNVYYAETDKNCNISIN